MHAIALCRQPIVAIGWQYSKANSDRFSAVAGLRYRSVSLGVTITDTFGNRSQVDLRPSLLIKLHGRDGVVSMSMGRGPNPLNCSGEDKHLEEGRRTQTSA